MNTRADTNSLNPPATRPAVAPDVGLARGLTLEPVTEVGFVNPRVPSLVSSAVGASLVAPTVSPESAILRDEVEDGAKAEAVAALDKIVVETGPNPKFPESVPVMVMIPSASHSPT